MGFIKLILLLLPLFISVAFVTLLERKILSLIGVRVGPNKVSLGGLLQPLGDAVKLSNKQPLMLSNFSFFYFFLSCGIMMVSSMVLWTTLFCSPSTFYYKCSFMVLMVVLGLNSFNGIIAGWSSFSKYSLIGSIRTVSQLISYESVLYFCFFFCVMCTMGFSFSSELPAFSVLLFPCCFYIWIPSFLAELNRTPYDFSEGESELVSGFNTEFGSKSFTLIFLAEYMNIIFFCSLSSFIFFSSSYYFFFLFFVFFVIWCRSVLPRYRFDKLMVLAWKFFIPFITCFFILFCSFIN